MEGISGNIRERLAEIRRKHYGQRGKARFARELGIQPSTYNHYEKDRSPPVDLLLRAARITRTNLQWLLTGRGPVSAAPTGQDTEADELAERLRGLLAARPELKRSATDFLALLESVAEEPQGSPSALSRQMLRGSELIPVVGSTAAGPAHFWEEIESFGGPEADARLEQVLQQQSQRAVHAAELTAPVTDSAERPSVSLLQLSRPDEHGFVEFLSCSAVKNRYPRAVAWRIDGDSMAPRYRDGDLVVTSTDQPAVEGHPCVARQRGQIGVNCKIFQRRGKQVLLIPVNEVFAVQQVDASDIVWACRVLCRVRLASR